MTRAAAIGVAPQDGYLLMTLPPYESPQATEAQISAMYDAVQQHNAHRLLIDCRATRERVPILDLFDLCIYMVSIFRPLQPKIAVLAAPEAAYPDRFGENVMRNRGLDVIRFLEGELAALDWLLAEPG